MEKEKQELEILKAKSPYSLPDNPSQSGWSAKQIKEKFYSGLIYLYSLFKEHRVDNETLIAEMKALVDEINAQYTAILNGVEKDSEGNVIAKTYAKKENLMDGSFPVLSYIDEEGNSKTINVLEATLNTLENNFILFKNFIETNGIKKALEAEKAKKDSEGNVIKDFYASISHLRDSLSGYYSKDEVDSNYATKSELFSKNYNDLTDKPTIPTKVSELENNSGYVTETAINEVKETVKTLGNKVDANENDIENKVTEINQQIENIKKVLTSDDTDFDTLQELVNALKNNVSSISDLFSELSKKVDKVSGKDLSTNDYTTEEKKKLKGIEAGANNYILPTDVVQDGSYVHTDNNYTTEEKNKLAGLSNYDDTSVKNALDNKANKSELFSKDYNDLTNKPTIPISANEVGAYTKEETNELLQNLLNRIIVLEQKVNENTNTNTTAVVGGDTLILTNANVENNTLKINGGSVTNETLTI
jgi:hypothetical protein